MIIQAFVEKIYTEKKMPLADGSYIYEIMADLDIEGNEYHKEHFYCSIMAHNCIRTNGYFWVSDNYRFGEIG